MEWDDVKTLLPYVDLIRKNFLPLDKKIEYRIFSSRIYCRGLDKALPTNFTIEIYKEFKDVCGVVLPKNCSKIFYQPIIEIRVPVVSHGIRILISSDCVYLKSNEVFPSDILEETKKIQGLAHIRTEYSVGRDYITADVFLATSDESTLCKTLQTMRKISEFLFKQKITPSEKKSLFYRFCPVPTHTIGKIFIENNTGKVIGVSDMKNLTKTQANLQRVYGDVGLLHIVWPPFSSDTVECQRR
ncbi:MAG: hypothetical protein ACP5LE_08160 [Thermoplasmata archaeon]